MKEKKEVEEKRRRRWSTDRPTYRMCRRRRHCTRQRDRCNTDNYKDRR